MKVRVNDNTQIAHGDKLYKGGQTFDAPEADARTWITAGYATEAGSKQTVVPSLADSPEPRQAKDGEAITAAAPTTAKKTTAKKTTRRRS